MRLHICRNLKQNNYMYTIREINDIACYRKLTWGCLLEKIYVTDCELQLRQVSYILKLLTLLPVFWLFQIVPFPPLIFFDRGVAKGKTYLSFFSPRRKIKINGDLFELYLHGDNYISVMKNESQVALIKRDNFTVAEETEYVIDLAPKTADNIKLILLLIAFADSTYFKSGLKWSFIKYDKYVGKSKHDERIAWDFKDSDMR